jgi:aminopeptidase N
LFIIHRLSAILSYFIPSVSPNIRSLVYKYHIEYIDDYNDWDALLNVYIRTVDPQEQAYILNALSYSRSTWILSLYLDEILKPNSVIKQQDFFIVLNAISRNPAGRSLAWYFFRKNWNRIVNVYVVISLFIAQAFLAFNVLMLVLTDSV